jgi:DnaK suppressor protein
VTARQRTALRTRLQRLRSAALAAGPARIEPNRRDPATAGVPDEDAQALSEMLQVLASQRNRGQADLLARLDRALARLEGEPEDCGLCEECEEPIPARRLEVMPWAVLCAGCQARREPRLGAPRKKLTDYR